MDIHERIERLRRQAAKVGTRELLAAAEAAGGRIKTGGKHPWKILLPGQPPITIPDHPGPRGKRLVNEVLDRIEASLAEQEEDDD